MASQRISVFTFFAVVQILIALIVSSAGQIRSYIGNPGQLSTNKILENVGFENFDSLNPQSYSSYESTLGLLPPLNGIITKYNNLIIKDNDIYGGVFGGEGSNGKYAVGYKNSGMSLHVKRYGPKGVTGLTFFSLYWSSINYANRLEFLHQEVLVYNFTGVDAYKMIDELPNSNQYYGNRYYNHWWHGRLNSHGYAFFEFEFLDSVFDEVRFGDDEGSGFESDNHSIGYHHWCNENDYNI